MIRRDFIKSAGALAMGVSMGRLHWADQPLNKKSLKYGMIKVEGSVEDKFALVKSLGFDGVELDSPSDLDLKEVLMARDKVGIQIPGLVNSLHWSSPLSDPNPDVRKKCVDSMLSAFDECKELGGTTVLLVPGVVNKEVSYKDAWMRSTKEIEKLIPKAESTGIGIAIENVWNNFLISPVEAVDYLDQFGSKSIGWYMDIGNIVRYGWPEHWIEALGERIMKVDIKEYSRDKQSNEGIWKGFDVKLGDGDCDWNAVNKALKSIGYSGWGSAEVPGGDATRLQEISDRMDKIYAL